jgi:glycosyltransferase involved in cell wall biosynthesis
MGLNLSRSGPTKTLLQANPRDRFAIHEYLNVALSKVGQIEAALASCEEGLSGLPTHADLLNNRKAYKVELARRSIRKDADFLVENGELRPEGAVIIKATLAGEFSIQLTEPPEETDPSCEPAEQPKREGCLDIVIYTGPALERWNPDTWRKTGMGGSETMAWHMARLLRARGHRVRVYADCTPTMQGVFEGVEWYNHSRYRNLKCDVLIVSRDPRAVDPEFKVEAGCRLLWAHDVHCGEALTHKRDLRFDRILCLSEWHRTFFLSVYPLIDASRVHVTRNGIDLSLFSEDKRWFEAREEDSEEGDLVSWEEPIPRNPHKAVYSSSPDRGLQTALDCWKDVRKEVPDAELHVYYGFENWEKSVEMFHDAKQAQTVRYLKKLAQSTPGVVVHGRMNQADLAREFLSAGVWAYPTWWTETSCITAMEAQAAGLYMVTSPIAALNETVNGGGVMIPGDWREPEYMQKWTEAIIDGMNNQLFPGSEAPIRAAIQKRAQKVFGLESLADDWDKMLRELHAEVTEKVVPTFTEIPEKRAP